MIKKINVVLAVAFVIVLGLKGLKEIKVAKERRASTPEASVQVGGAESLLAPNVYYLHWTYFSAEDPLSNRNGVMLDTLRAIFPNAKYTMLRGGPEVFVKKLSEDPRAIVVGFGFHPLFKDCLAAETPLAYGKVILMTLRSNPWRYEGESSLDKVRIVMNSDSLDFKLLRERHERLGPDSPLLRVFPPSTSHMELAAMVESGKADAFVVEGEKGGDGIVADTMSVRILQRFRKSDEICRGDALLYISKLDKGFAKDVLEAYETGIRRIEASGERRRIFEYYGLVPAPVQPKKE